MFPLPGETIALHIFEPRYQELFRRLELGDLEEFGIAFQTAQQDASEPKAEWGSLMRLIFVTPTDAKGPRDVVVKCVGLFRIESLHHAPPFSPEPFPTGRIESLTSWKRWRTSAYSQKELASIKRILASQSEKSDNQRPEMTLITAAMIHLQFNPLERAEVLSSGQGMQVEKQFAQVVRFKRMILEQEALRKGEHFPN